VLTASPSTSLTDLQLKTQALLKGRLRVYDDLPAHLQHGLFAPPGKYHDVIARFANEPYKILPDPDGQPRGVALKVFDVEGDKMDGSEGTTQDFFFNNAPQLEVCRHLPSLEVSLTLVAADRHQYDPRDLPAPT
jgi:hypothetical protein